MFVLDKLQHYKMPWERVILFQNLGCANIPFCSAMFHVHM